MDSSEEFVSKINIPSINRRLIKEYEQLTEKGFGIFVCAEGPYPLIGEPRRIYIRISKTIDSHEFELVVIANGNEYPFLNKFFILTKPFYYRTEINTPVLLVKHVEFILSKIIEKEILPKHPDKRFLVIGSVPSEPKKGRAFYYNPIIYSLDNTDYDGESEERYIQSDLRDLSIFSEKYPLFFDAISFDQSVLKYLVHEDEQIFVEIMKSLKPGGILYLPSSESTKAFLMGIRMLNANGHWNDIGAKQMLVKCEKAGFKNLEMEKMSELAKTSDLIRDLFISVHFDEEKDKYIAVFQKPSSGGRKTLRNNNSKRKHKTKKRFQIKGDS